MSSYTSLIEWQRGDARFTDNRYSRAHAWSFDGGVTVPASSSPHVVPLPYSEAANVDPEEAFVAALASCHMLFFLSLAAKAGFVIDRYTDNAEGVMERNADGQVLMTTVTLRPAVAFSGDKVPDDAAVDALHHTAHEQCFLANSVKSEMAVRGTWTHAAVLA